MSHSDKAIFIIGGGVSGLVCAQVLEQYGYQPTILEISSRVGGRVVTDHKNGYQLDKGFQVMLDAYPLTKKYLKYDQLELQKLSPGAVLFKDGKQSKFGDPLRDSQFLFPTFTSSHATLLDKWKVYRLRKKLLKKSTEDIFETPETTTLKYLKAQGFSNRIINNFFKPFFSGIYLETDLSTSSRMFEFVYKMFAEGDATIPKSGIQEIPDQLHSQLKQTDVRLNTGVISVSNEEIMLESGEVLKSDFCVIATDPEGILPNYTSSLEWKSCDTLYFTSHTREIRSPIIGLNTNPNALVNNIFYASSVET
ncbi:MAG: FAD-dependent oxidoreductase, partial [Bacteroidota bacterium]